MVKRLYFAKCPCNELFLTSQRLDERGRVQHGRRCGKRFRLPYDPEEAADDWIALVEGRLAVDDLVEKYGKYGITREHFAKLVEREGEKKPRTAKAPKPEKPEELERLKQELRDVKQRLSAMERDMKELCERMARALVEKSSLKVEEVRMKGGAVYITYKVLASSEG